MRKCYVCLLYLHENQCEVKENDILCPICHGKTELMCARDHRCVCWDPISSGVLECPICHESTCPCGSHDVAVVSRVTGYLSNVAGWNAAKRQELKDRHRVDITI